MFNPLPKKPARSGAVSMFGPFVMAEVYARAEGRCAACESFLPFDGTAKFDHLHPYSKRGVYTTREQWEDFNDAGELVTVSLTERQKLSPRKSINEVENLTILCESCNSEKTNRYPSEYFGAKFDEVLRRSQTPADSALVARLVSERAAREYAVNASSKYARLAKYKG